MGSLVPSLILKEKITLVKTRELPLKGRVMVEPGQQVAAEDIVADAEMPGDLVIVKLLEQTGLDQDVILKSLTLKEGDLVTKGELIFKYQTFFGFFETSVVAPISGKIEFVSPQNAHIGIRGAPKKVELKAYLAGVVQSVRADYSVEIKSEASMLQGIFGVGGERFGKLRVVETKNDLILAEDDLPTDLAGQIIVASGAPTTQALKIIAESGATGLVVGSIDNDVLSEYLGYELGLPITGSETIPFTLIITEGFGEIRMSDRYFDLFTKLAGLPAAINGATQIRAGAVRPEVIVANTPLKSNKSKNDSSLEQGAKVKVIRYPYFGMHGVVLHLPVAPELVETGALVRVAELELEDRRVVTVPRANLELV